MRPRKYQWFDPPILHNVELPKKIRRGRPLGSGPNLRLFDKMEAGDAISGISEAKMRSLRTGASKVGVRFAAVKLESGYYIIKIIEKKGRREQ